MPDRLRARVLGAVSAVAWVGIPVGSLAGGVLVEGIGLRAALLATGGAYLLVTLTPFVLPGWRQLDRPPAGEATGQDRAWPVATAAAGPLPGPRTAAGPPPDTATAAPVPAGCHAGRP